MTTNAWNLILIESGGDEWLARCSAALIEVQTETLNRAIKRLSARLDAMPMRRDAADADLVDGLHEAVDILTNYRNGL